MLQQIIHVTVLMLLGANSIIYAEETATATIWEGVIGGLAHVEYVLMEEASHNPHTEPSTAEAFDRHLTGWVSSIK